MSTEKKSAGEIQQAIKQGAITREYKADAKRVIQALNGLRSTEVMSYLQYMQHQYMAVSLLSPGMKAEFQAHATQELDHAIGWPNASNSWAAYPSMIQRRSLRKLQMSVSYLSKGPP